MPSAIWRKAKSAFICRWVHFSGDGIYMLDDVSASDAASANFAELTMNALIDLPNKMARSGGSRLYKRQNFFAA
jgi:hypothetical protein